ncbi:MAG: amidophosphoribosyltransferase [Deltaproteobacteria bacterium]|nr:amidophosphoribosyltransferase [Deltaproteobacteria bacterium]MCL5791596.1 amidophosphoribosyltransferase [Deltaproteobacteria bacterium]
MDELKEDCGVFGIWDDNDAAKLTYLGLYALQHRGQESAGIAISDGTKLYSYKQMGYVNEIFNEHVLAMFRGKNAIGHVRYSTYGSSDLRNAQPFAVEYKAGGLAIAHNGNIVNYETIRTRLENEGSIFQSTMDTEVIVHLVAKSNRETLHERLAEALNEIRGAYSLLVLTENELIAVRDPYGFRPLVIGTINDKFVFASETCAFDLIGAKYMRDVLPGEMIMVNKSGMRSYRFSDRTTRGAQCVFEHIYFARPDSIVFGKSVYSIRVELGKMLGKESPADADIIVPVPDSGVPAAIGYAQQTGIPFQMALIRNHYVGRTFIQPQQSIRDFNVRVKLNPISELIEGKEIVVIDDSIVRGTTSRKLIKMIRDAGAKKVHFRISSPPITSSCYYGIDTPTKEELIAANHALKEINAFIGADSLAYLSLEGLRAVVRYDADNFCYACFNGDYPEPFETSKRDHQLILFDDERSMGNGQ